LRIAPLSRRTLSHRWALHSGSICFSTSLFPGDHIMPDSEPTDCSAQKRDDRIGTLDSPNNWIPAVRRGEGNASFHNRRGRSLLILFREEANFRPVAVKPGIDHFHLAAALVIEGSDSVAAPH
jgi:hypothetical protein